jgi:arginine repressor
MKHDTAGDPMTGLKWTRRTSEKIAQELARAGICVSASTVRRLLKKMGFSLRVNHKKLAGKSSPGRDQQFRYIERMRNKFTRKKWPLLSIDTKKKEMVGNFKNNGATWE